MSEPIIRPAPGAPRPRTGPAERRSRTPRTAGGQVAPTQPTRPVQHGWRVIPAWLRWTGSILVLLAVAIAIFAAVFQWNWLRGPVGSYLSGRFHRAVTIHGDLSADIWSLTPSATANEVTVAEPAWARDGPMLSIPRLTVSLDLKALLGGKLILPVVDAERPTAILLRDATGRNNWSFSAPGAAGAPLQLPAIRHFIINDGRLTLDDARRKLHFAGTVSSNEQLTGYGRGRFTLTGKGVLNDAVFTAQILGGPLIDVDPNRPYPFTADIHAGPTHVMATGDITHPFDFGVAQASGHITGPDMADLYELTGFAVPNSPPYDLYGQVTRNGARFDIAGIHGRVGESDVAGHLTANEVAGRRDLTGALASRRLKLADLTAIIGGAPRGAIKGTITSPQQKVVAAQLTAEHRILPDARLEVARVRDMDADVTYHADSVDAGPLPIRQVSVHARLDHGLLTLSPLSLTLPQGALSGRVMLDARPATPLTTIDLTLANAQIAELLGGTKGAGAIQGELEARARLTGSGASIREAAANANGVVAVAIPQGQMKQLFAELLGIDATKSLFLYLAHDQTPTPVRCAVAEFHASGGVLTAQRILIDTGAVQATGQGVIDLRSETMDLSISGKPKHFRLIRIAAPITLKGPLDGAKFGVDAGKAAGQLATSALLGALVSPVAAIIPFVAGGTSKDANCPALLEEAATHGAPVAAGR